MLHAVPGPSQTLKTNKSGSDTPGRGAHWLFILFSIANSAAKLIAYETTSSLTTVGGECMRILVVDDDDTLRLSLKLGLESRKYQVDEARNGDEAVQFVQKRSYEAVILDVNMPRLNGLAALKKIKALDPRSLCIILTAHSDVKDAVTAIKYGAYDYIEKPAETEQIIEVMNSAMEANALVEAIAFLLAIR